MVEPPIKRTRVDAQGFAIPDLPRRLSADGPSTTPAPSSDRRKPGRRPGVKNKPIPPATQAEQVIEDELQRDIDLTLSENPDLDPIPITEPLNDKGVPVSIVARLAQVKALSLQRGNTNTICLDPEIETDEFEDDEEVAICLLTEAERRMKEIVWVQSNADWLRKEHVKKIKYNLKVQELIDKGIDPFDSRQIQEKGRSQERWQDESRASWRHSISAG